MLFSISGTIVYSQDLEKEYMGIYRDYPTGYTELFLKEDGTFTLNFYGLSHQGLWGVKGNEVILNPEKNKRFPKISLSEQKVKTLDSIEIIFNYQIETYENEKFVECADYEFDILSVYLNKPKYYVNVVRQPLRSYCAFSPRIKKQVLLNLETNSIKIKKTKKGISKIGIHAPDFDLPIELNLADPLSNRLELFIVHSVDKEKTLRSKPAEKNGKVVRTFYRMPLTITLKDE